MNSLQRLSLLLTTLLPLPVAAQQHDRDTLSAPVYATDEVVVTGARQATDVRHLSQTVSVINRPTIEQSQRASLLPLLAEEVPGLFVTSRGVMGYGVSGGAAGNISLRGLSGSSGQLMVLIDGHPQYAGIFGHPISDAYQSFLAERVEVLRGPASVLYGSNAMGGVINIVTRKMHQDGVTTRFRGGYGSYNTLETELTNQVQKGRFSSVLSGSYNRTDGHRPDMGFEQYGGYARLGYELTDQWSVRADANITHFNASYPGPVTAPLLDGDQRITRGMTSLAIENQYQNTSGALSFFYNWGNHWINDGYTPSEGETPPDDRFLSYDDMMGASLYQSVRFGSGSRLTVGFDWFRYGGHAWNEYVSGPDVGSRNDLVDKHENEWAAYADWRQNVGRWLTLNVGLRADHHSRLGWEWVPQAGAAFHLPHAIDIKLSASKGFRYPILREMYMFPPQNPNLKPESLWNYEIAFAQRLLNGRLSYGVNLFYIDARNLIQTLPNPSGSGMLNQNTGQLNNAGVEVQASYRINRWWSVEGNYSYLHMKRPVVAAPQHKLHLGGTWQWQRWTVSSGVDYIDGLYTQVSPTERTESFLLWNLRASFRVTPWLSLWARGENLLNQTYEINAGYPMPGITAMGGVQLNF